MIVHTVTVRNRRVTVDNRTVTANGVGSDALAFDLDDEWDGLTINAIVGTKVAAVDPSTLLVLPTFDDAGFVPLSLVGMAPDGGLRIVTNDAPRALQVVESGSTGEVMTSGIAMG